MNRSLLVVCSCLHMLAPTLDSAVSQAIARGAEVSVEVVAKTWEARTEQVRTLHFKWDDRYTVTKGAYAVPDESGRNRKNPKNLVLPPETTTYDTSFSLAMDGVQFRHEGRHIWLSPNSELMPQDYVWVFSRELLKTYSPPGSLPNPTGNISAPPPGDSNDLSDPNVFPMAALYRPFHPLLREFAHFPKRFSIVPGRYSVRGTHCVLLKDEQAVGISTALWLDPGRDFIIMRLSSQDGPTLIYDLNFFDYSKEDSIWIPARWKSTFFGAGEETVSTNESTVREHSLNADIDPGQFQFEFPVDTWVTDLRSQSDFIQKEGGQKREISRGELFSGATYEYFVNTPAARPLERRHGQKWLIAVSSGILVLALLVAVAIVFRRKSFRSE
jgi:hypothetical protein